MTKSKGRIRVIRVFLFSDTWYLQEVGLITLMARFFLLANKGVRIEPDGFYLSDFAICSFGGRNLSTFIIYLGVV